MTLAAPPDDLAQRPADMRLPYRFQVPPGWPRPTARWQAEHQGRVPGDGWTAEPGLAPAPSGWIWWERDAELWATPMRKVTVNQVVGLAIAALVAFCAVDLTHVASVWDSGWRIVIGGALAFGPLEASHRIAALGSTGRTLSRRIRRRSAAVARIPGAPLPSDWFAPSGAGSSVHRIATMCVSGALAALLIGVIGVTIGASSTTS